MKRQIRTCSRIFCNISSSDKFMASRTAPLALTQARYLAISPASNKVRSSNHFSVLWAWTVLSCKISTTLNCSGSLLKRATLGIMRRSGLLLRVTYRDSATRVMARGLIVADSAAITSALSESYVASTFVRNSQLSFWYLVNTFVRQRSVRSYRRGVRTLGR